MIYTINKEQLITPLSLLTNISTIKQPTFPVLSNVLLEFSRETLKFTTTDLELELSYQIDYPNDNSDFSITLPCKKLYDIVRNLSDGAEIKFNFTDNNKVQLHSNKSKFVLSTIAAPEFPTFEKRNNLYTFHLSSDLVHNAIYFTEFSMGTKDVRFYLNSLLFELKNNTLKTVSTDGHRLSYYETSDVIYEPELPKDAAIQLLLPRKATHEIQKLITSDGVFIFHINHNYLSISLDKITLYTKLIDSKFPEYNRVIPKSTSITIEINKIELKEALLRTSVLSNEKYKAVRFDFSNNNLKISIHNTDHEEAVEDIFIDYDGEEFTTGFNIHYIIDCLNHIEDNIIQLNLTESYNSCIIQGKYSDNPLYVVMPMRL